MPTLMPELDALRSNPEKVTSMCIKYAQTLLHVYAFACARMRAHMCPFVYALMNANKKSWMPRKHQN